MSATTNGWDAVCAINAANINQLFRNWYLNNGPVTGQAGPHIQLLVSGNPGELILDVQLGPPEVSFPPDGQQQQATVSMIVTSGVLLQCDVRQHVVNSAFILQPDIASITGTVDLTRAQGVPTLGEVQLNLAAGSYTPVIAGLDPDSEQVAYLSAEIGSFFAANPVSVPLGGVNQSNVPDCLQPTLFEFCVQPNPAQPDDGCVLLLIQTNGNLGTLGLLPCYPIPAGSTASLIVSNQVLFDQLFPAQLRASMAAANLPLLFIGQQDSSGAYYTLVSVGEQQGWVWKSPVGLYTSYDTAQSEFSYTAQAPVTIVNPKTCVVTFPTTGTPQCHSHMDPTLADLFGALDSASQIQSSIGQKILPVFENLPVRRGAGTRLHYSAGSDPAS